MAIPGCTFGCHTTEKPEEPATTSQSQKTTTDGPTQVTKDGVEVYGSKAVEQQTPVAQPTKEPEVVETKQEEEEEDDESVPVQPGTICKRRGCGVAYKDDATSRGDGPEAKCTYHPGAPVFHEGSKGWSCCKRRVLEFDEFLKIAGCKEGKHLFVGRQKEASVG